MKRLIFVIALIVFAAQLSSQQRRMALVIGNSNYDNGAPLANPENDATDIEALLISSGFEVKKYIDLDQVSMKKSIDEFGHELGSAHVGLFFYAGHGIQSKGRNYLIPVDAALRTENDIEYNCIDAGRILAKMEDAGNKTNIVILDACRDNPFERSWSRKSTGQGLAFMNAPNGSIIAYSTSPGKTASDGYKRNSPYTASLLQFMNVPNVKIEDFFKMVRIGVREKTNGDQIPWEATSLEGDFYFKIDPDYVPEGTSVSDIFTDIDINSSSAQDRTKEFENERERRASQIRSIAILPFSNYTGDDGQAYIAAGLHDALITELGQIGDLRVISKTSTLGYANFQKSIKEIASELNVDGIIESSLMSSEGEIKIQLKLFSTHPDEQLVWSQSFSSELSEIFNLYSTIVRDITGQVQLSLSPELQLKLNKPRVVNPEAYKAYLNGKFHLGFLTQEGQQAALDYFNQAAEIDPEYAPAYGGMAGIWIVLKQMDFVSTDVANPKIKEFMSKAVELESKNAEVYYWSAAKAVWTDFDWQAGEEAFKKVFEINPNYAEAWAYYAHYLMIVNRLEEMSAAMKKARDLDPNNYLIMVLETVVLLRSGEFETAIKQSKQLQQFMPTNPLLAMVLMQAYAETEQYDQAIDQVAILLGHHENDTIVNTLKHVYQEQGFEAAMNAAADAIEEFAPFVAPQHMYLLYGYGGNKDKFIYWVERAYIRNDPGNPYLGAFLILKRYSKEPRLIEILERMKLPLPETE